MRKDNENVLCASAFAVLSVSNLNAFFRSMLTELLVTGGVGAAAGRWLRGNHGQNCGHHNCISSIHTSLEDHFV